MARVSFFSSCSSLALVVAKLSPLLLLVVVGMVQANDLIQIGTDCTHCDSNNCGQYASVANNSCHSFGRDQVKVTCPDPNFLTEDQKQCATFRQWSNNSTSCSESSKLDQVSFTCGQCLPTGGKALFEKVDCNKETGELNFLWECFDHTCTNCAKKTPFSLTKNGPGTCTSAVGALFQSGRYWQLVDVRSCYPTLLTFYADSPSPCAGGYLEHVSTGNGQCLADFFVTCPGQPTNPPATFAPVTPAPTTAVPTTTPVPPTPVPTTTTPAPATPAPITTPVPLTPIPRVPLEVRFYPEARCNGTGSDPGPESGGTGFITDTGNCLKIPSSYKGGLPAEAKAVVFSGCGDQLLTGIFKTVQVYSPKCSTLQSLRRLPCLSRSTGSQISRCFLAEDGQYHKFDCSATPAVFSDCGQDASCHSCAKSTELFSEQCYPNVFPMDSSGGGVDLLGKIAKDELEVEDDEGMAASSGSPSSSPSPGGQNGMVVGFEQYDAGPGIRMQVFSKDDCDPASLIIDQYTEERFCNAGIRAFCPGSRTAVPQASPHPQTSVAPKPYLHAVVTGNCQDNFCGSCDAPQAWEDGTCYNIPEWERNNQTSKGAASFEFSCNNYTSGANECANVQVFSDSACTQLVNSFNPVCDQCKQDSDGSFFYIGCNTTTGAVTVRTGCTDPSCNATLCKSHSTGYSQPVGKCVSTPWPGVYHVNYGLYECYGVEQIYYSEANCTGNSRFFRSQVARDRCNDFSTISCRYSDNTLAPTTTVAPPTTTPVPTTPIPPTTTLAPTTPVPETPVPSTTTEMITTTTTTTVASTTTTTTTTAPSSTAGPTIHKNTPSPNGNQGNAPPAGPAASIKGKLPIIIGAGVGGLVLLIVLACVVRKCCFSSSSEGRGRSNSVTESAVSLQDGLLNASDGVKLCNLPEGPQKEAIRVRVTQFYKQHNPAQMDKVEKIWKYDMTEEELMNQLNSKYCSTN